MDNLTQSRNPKDPDQVLLSLRDELETRRAEGDDRWGWLLTMVYDEISRHARQACLDDQPTDNGS